MKRIAAISRKNAPHHIDHLLPICDLLDAKFLTDEDTQRELVERYYPFTNYECIDGKAFSTEYFRAHFDIIIHSFPWPKEIIDYSFSRNEKKLRTIFTPHGNSDKNHLFNTWQDYRHNDISLIYGSQMEEALKGANLSLEKTMKMGNLRYAYYKKHKAFFDPIVEKEVFSKLDPKKKTVLYAPSWNYTENSSSLYLNDSAVLNTLSLHYNVILKIHPWQHKDNIGKLYHIIAKYEDKKDVVILEKFPLIFPLLAKTDVYLGDFSSIGYDFLVFDKPMFFFNHLHLEKTAPSLFLQRCGIEVPSNSPKELLETIERNALKDEKLSKIRQNIWRYAFDESIQPEDIRRKILKGML